MLLLASNYFLYLVLEMKAGSPILPLLPGKTVNLTLSVLWSYFIKMTAVKIVVINRDDYQNLSLPYHTIQYITYLILVYAS